MLELKSSEALRTLDIARSVLDDIGEIRHCKYTIAYANRTLVGARIPVLYMEFDYPEIADSGMQPALAISVTNLATGNLHNDDKLRRMIRVKVEEYLTKVGRPQKAIQIEAPKIISR